jgi:hypothetical protein
MWTLPWLGLMEIAGATGFSRPGGVGIHLALCHRQLTGNHFARSPIQGEREDAVHDEAVSRGCLWERTEVRFDGPSSQTLYGEIDLDDAPVVTDEELRKLWGKP